MPKKEINKLEKFKLALLDIEKMVKEENDRYDIIHQLDRIDVPSRVELNWSVTKAVSSDGAFSLLKPKLSTLEKTSMVPELRIFRLLFTDEDIFSLCLLSTKHIAALLANSIETIILSLREEYNDMCESGIGVGIGTHFIKFGMPSGELVRIVSNRDDYNVLERIGELYELRLTSCYRPIPPPEVNVVIESEEQNERPK